MTKYFAVFEIPDDYDIGYAVAKIAPKVRENYSDEDFENVYAKIEPLSEKNVEIFERFNVVENIMNKLGISCANDMPSFWKNNGKDYVVIPTKFHKGYMQALKDVENEVRLCFGFAEREESI